MCYTTDKINIVCRMFLVFSMDQTSKIYDHQKILRYVRSVILFWNTELFIGPINKNN